MVILYTKPLFMKLHLWILIVLLVLHRVLVQLKLSAKLFSRDGNLDTQPSLGWVVIRTPSLHATHAHAHPRSLTNTPPQRGCPAGEDCRLRLVIVILCQVDIEIANGST